MSGTKAGPAIGAPLAAWLIVAVDWRAMFVIVGAMCAMWLGPWLLIVREDQPPAVRRTDGAPPALSARQLFASQSFASPLIWGTLVVNVC